jgi:hypothetical protein
MANCRIPKSWTGGRLIFVFLDPLLLLQYVDIFIFGCGDLLIFLFLKKNKNKIHKAFEQIFEIQYF